jgi:hypothetical protein
VFGDRDLHGEVNQEQQVKTADVRLPVAAAHRSKTFLDE